MCDGLVYEGLCADFCQPGIGWCDTWSFRVGFYGDYVFNRHLEVDQGNTKDRDIEKTELYTNAGYLAVNFWDRIDIFGTLGASNIRIDGNVIVFQGTFTAAAGGNRFRIESETDFSWSIGGRGTLYECGCFSFGAETQYFFTRPEMKRITYDDQSSVMQSNYSDFAEMKYQEWQFGLGISYRIWNFVPYLGIKYSWADLDLDRALIADINGNANTTDYFPNADNQFHWGYAVGVSLVDCEKASLTLEARYPDEKAVYVNGQIRF